MKKGLCLGLVLLLFVAMDLMAGSLSDAVEIKEAVGSEDLRVTMEREALAIAPSLDPAGKRAYYEEHAISLGWPIAKAVLVGFGSGSRSIGDKKGAVPWGIAEGVGAGSLAIGGVLFVVDFLAGSILHGIAGSEYQADSDLAKITIGMMIGGASVMLVSRIIQIVRVAVWGSSYNRTLRTALGLDGNLEVAVVPTVPTAFTPASLSVVASLKL